jgi:VanZ family protein
MATTGEKPDLPVPQRPPAALVAHAPDAPQVHPGSYRIAIALVLLLIVYGSLYPLQWNFGRPQDFVWHGPIGLGDLLENVALFVPLGWLLAWYHRAPTGRTPGFARWFVIAFAVAFGLQWLQKYLPRIPALSDVAFNMLGHVGGWWAGRLSVALMDRLHRRHAPLQAADRFAVAMVALWCVAELFPLIPTIDVSSVADNVKSLWQRPWWEPRRMLLHAGMTLIGLEATAALLRSLAWPGPLRPAVVAVAVAVLGGKFVVVHQAPGMAVVLGICGGLALWLGFDRLPGRSRLAAVFVVALATYLLQAIWPWQWRPRPGTMGLMPFGSALSGNLESNITNVAFECLCFGALVWAAVRRGARAWRMTIGVALLALACEWAQRYLPGRTAEITSVLVALGMGWMVAALAGVTGVTGADRVAGVVRTAFSPSPPHAGSPAQRGSA